MISIIKTNPVSTVKTVDCSVVSSSLLGFSNLGTGLSGMSAGFAVSGVELSGLGSRERAERPTQAPGAVAVAAIQAYAPAAAGAGNPKQELTQHHTMWAFRGLKPWSDPT
ncbi:hypothetical protein HUT18_24195 [Streptomyces sp. NA04227]|uniref:hypothetical protein n=1 Tax=Streptomyces sp. NA04227 TaxID=2742136 RepID=UPI001591FDEA|nr:hypothetical protein [Streptomyces sp. NA04227]QKW09021.1 hypothetical protein HUT18_24195 [Streptomyces sp. NA04227]